MELDHLKQLWSNENIVETPEISTEKQKEIRIFPSAFEFFKLKIQRKLKTK